MAQNSLQGLIIVENIVDDVTGLYSGFGICVRPRFTMSLNQVVCSFGKVVLCTVAHVARYKPWWARYGIFVSKEYAFKHFGVHIDEDSILIPAAKSRTQYLYGEKAIDTPVGSLDASNKGALINSCLRGRSPHLTWKVTYCKITLQWGVNIVCARDFVARGKGYTQLLLYYGPEFVEYIEACAARDAALKALPPTRFVPKNGGNFCKLCKKFYPIKPTPTRTVSFIQHYKKMHSKRA